MPCPILSANSRRPREPHGNGGGGWKKIDTRIRGDAEGGEQNEMRRFLFNLRRACHATGTHPRRLERRTLAAFLGARNRLPLLRRNLDLARSARYAREARTLILWTKEQNEMDTLGSILGTGASALSSGVFGLIGNIAAKAFGYFENGQTFAQKQTEWNHETELLN